MSRESAISAGWKYEKSNHGLFDEFAFRETSEGIEVYTSDKVRYTPAEVKLLPTDGTFPVLVHIVKKLFEGTIEDRNV